jgi:hypothetical protein
VQVIENIVSSRSGTRFKLQEVYASRATFAERFKKKDVESGIRKTLQELRNRGIVKFLTPGEYSYRGCTREDTISPQQKTSIDKDKEAKIKGLSPWFAPSRSQEASVPPKSEATSQELVPYITPIPVASSTNDTGSLHLPTSYDTGSLQEDCKKAWKRESALLRMERDLLGGQKRGREEEKEDIPSKKARKASPAKAGKAETGAPVLRKTASILSASKKQPAVGITQPALTKKYLNFSDAAASAGGRPASRATFKMIEEQIGLCRIDEGEARTARTLLLYRKGGWALTPAGKKLVLSRTEGKSVVFIDSSIRCPPLRDLTECMDAFLPSRFEDSSEYINYENISKRQRLAFSQSVKEHTKFAVVRDQRGIPDFQLYGYFGCIDQTVIFGFPFAKMQKRWREDVMGKTHRLVGMELMGVIVMMHYSMLFTAILNSIAHNSAAAGQPAFRALLRELLLSSHPDSWVTQTSDFPELGIFLTKFQQRLGAWIEVFAAMRKP